MSVKFVADVPELLAMWDASNPGRPDQTPLRLYKGVWWRCKRGHRFERQPRMMQKDMGCPTCKVRSSSLRYEYPGLAKQWCSAANDGVGPSHVDSQSTAEMWWNCASGHTFKRSPLQMVKNGSCPTCAKSETSLLRKFPHIAKFWNQEKNGTITPDQVTPDANFDAWWRCAKGHEYQQSVRRRVLNNGNCPRCFDNWPIEKIRAFVRSLAHHIESFTPAERYALAIQAGIFDGPKACQEFVKDFTSGKFPLEELEKFAKNEPNKIEEEMANYADRSKEDFNLRGQSDAENQRAEKGAGAYAFQNSESSYQDHGVLDQEITGGIRTEEGGSGSEDPKTKSSSLPLVKTNEALAALDKAFVANPDNETVRFLQESAKAKLWRHAYLNAEEARVQAEGYESDTYSRIVVEDFLGELRAAERFELPQGYRFRPGGSETVVRPNLMQRHVALSVCRRRRFGNWSGMGAGKTLSAILATRTAKAKMTVVVCPNAVVKNWCQEIDGAFEGCQVQSKTWTPSWKEDGRPRYLVMNFEQFQLKSSEDNLLDFMVTVTPKVDFIVIDEIHQTKQRSPEKMSRRKKMVQGLLVRSKEANEENLHVLGMSGTPVINNLQEGKSLIEMVDLHVHHELQTKATVQNCMKLHQWFVSLGTRYRPNYAMQLDESCRPEMNCELYLDDIREVANGTILQLEQILTKVRLPAIVDAIKLGEKAIVYTHYVQGIVPLLREGLMAAGHRVGMCTGEDDDSDIDEFKKVNGRVDVLIASSRISVGVDGLQRVCNKLVVNILPWTSAEYDQLKARLWRQGSEFETVHVVVPVTYADLKGGRWSYCESKFARLAYKQSIADAAVDGEVPEGNLRNETQAQSDIMGWLQRLDEDREITLERQVVEVPLSRSPEAVEKRLQDYGDFVAMNNRWYMSKSEATHQRLKENPEEWAHYHTMYRELRESWTVIPYEEEIDWLSEEGRDIQIVGDFGCGEAEISKRLKDKYQFYNLDHIAIDRDVIACDLANVPLANESLQLAIFCLSLMGSNCTEYIRQAHRVLEMDGWLHIWESGHYIKNVDAFCDDLERLGFDVIRPHKIGKFMKIYARKSREHTDPTLKLRFR